MDNLMQVKKNRLLQESKDKILLVPKKEKENAKNEI
jgi:hypothetical protein